MPLYRPGTLGVTGPTGASGASGLTGLTGVTGTSYDAAQSLNTLAATGVYTLVASDVGDLVLTNTGVANVVVIPANASVPFATGSRVDLVQLGAGQTTVTGATGVTVNPATHALRTQYSAATMVVTAADTWEVFGDLAGVVGLPGSTGATGADGLPGIDGLPGATGPQGVSGSGGSGAAGGLTQSVSQTGHGFTGTDVVRLSGVTYIKAQADSSTNAEVVGIVSAVADANTFTLQMGGRMSGFASLTAGSTYFLHPSTAGALTGVEPSSVGQVSKPILLADTTGTGYMFNFRGEVLGVTGPLTSANPVSRVMKVRLFR